MAKLTPDQFAEKWSRRTQQAVPDYVEGIRSVSEAPGKAAGRQEAKMKQKVNEALDSGRWKRGVERVSLNDWQDAATSKGAGRIAAGVQGAQDKQRLMAEKLLPVIDAGKAKISNMPSTTLQDNINRMTAFVTHMAENPIKK